MRPHSMVTRAMEIAALVVVLIMAPGCNKLRARAELNKGVQAYKNAKYDQAIDYFKKAVQLDPSNGEAINDLFDFYLEAPSLLGGGIDKARKLLPAIGNVDPAEVHFAQARIEEKRKNFDMAESELRRAAELAPRSVGRVIDLAKFLARRGHYDESDKLFQQAEKLAPNAPKVLYARADSLINTQRNTAQARELLKKYLDANNLTPDDPSRWEARKLLKKVEGS